LLRGTGSRSAAASAQAKDWFFQVGANAAFPYPGAAIDLWTQIYYCPNSCITYPDTTYSPSVWPAASNVADQGAHWYQVGYAYYHPSFADPRHVFFQDNFDGRDPYGYSYLWCNSQIGMQYSNGANDQPFGGCEGNADTLGLADGNTYWVQIYITSDCASGTGGCLYGCNGNMRLAINGNEIGHVADCDTWQGMAGFTGGMMEPSDGNITDENQPSQYPAWSALNWIQALLTDGTTPTPAALSITCGYFPPAGTGSVIWSNTAAGFETAQGQCPGRAAPAAAASTPTANKTPSPGSKPNEGEARRLPPRFDARLLGTPPSRPSGGGSSTPVLPIPQPSVLPHRHVNPPGSPLPPPPLGGLAQYVTVLPGTTLPSAPLAGATATPIPANRDH